MQVKVKKMHPHAVLPTYGTDRAAGLDLCVTEDTWVHPLEPTLLPTGIAIEYPKGTMGVLALRSSTPKKKGVFIPNGVGIIDEDYRGEHFVMVAAFKEPVLIKAGERIAQLVIVPARQAEGIHIDGVIEVDDLSDTARGAGGFGSTG